MPRQLLAAGAAGTAALTTAVAARLLDAAPPGGRDRWERTSHSGRTVTLTEGPAVVAGAATGALAAGSPAGALAVVASGALGALDDHVGATDVKGLKGHLGALRRGRVTTGAVKIVGLAATGVAAAALVDRPDGPAEALGTLVGGIVVAGAANVANLLDLRPGRCLKACTLAAAPLLPTTPTAAAVVGASAVALPADLGRRAMLGDTGANAAGALVGVALVESLGLPGRVVAAGVLSALVVASERVSFTKVIESTPALARLDAWGRAPA